MDYSAQNAKIASITEKTLIVGIDVGSETHYARVFDWRNYALGKFLQGNNGMEPVHVKPHHVKKSEELDNNNPRACLKNALCRPCVTVCGEFVPNEGGVAGYADRMWGRLTAKWSVRLA